MSSLEKADDFEIRRQRLRAMSEEELHRHFWKLAEQLVAPLIEEARTHTSPSIERSVLLRMGFSSLEAKALVGRLGERGLLDRGAGGLVLDLAKRKGLTVREVGAALLDGRLWEEIGA